MRFSERKGLTKARTEIQSGEMSDELRASLWNVLHLQGWGKPGFTFVPNGVAPIRAFARSLWFEFLKTPIDTIPEYGHEILESIRNFFFKAEWFRVYDFIEFVVAYYGSRELEQAFNQILGRELAGFRIVAGTVTELTDSQEMTLLSEALEDQSFPGVAAHLRRALELLSDRKTPDFRNSIKESISAVEAMARFLTGEKQAALGDALKVLERKHKLHPALKEGFSKLYGYTSNEGGIRHGMLDEPSLGIADARFFLLSCTSFINYLKALV